VKNFLDHCMSGKIVTPLSVVEFLRLAPGAVIDRKISFIFARLLGGIALGVAAWVFKTRPGYRT